MKHFVEHEKHYEIIDLTVTQEFLRREEGLSPEDFARKHGIESLTSVNRKFVGK